MNLKELSRLLGLSQTTVSRALNGYPEVNEMTRERVMTVARQNHYRPSARAKALATGRAMAIGHVIPLGPRNASVNPVAADLLAGAAEAYAAAGYEMHLSVVPPDQVERTYRELAAKRAVDGVIVDGPIPEDPRIPLLSRLGLPFVVNGRSSGTDLAYNWLDMNNSGAFERATGFLIDLGHRRIGLVNGPAMMDFARRRRHGYEAAQRARGIEPDPALVQEAEMTEAHGHRSARAMLASDDPPTAFLVSSIISAVGVRRAIEESGLRMGRDVSVITHDDELGYLRNGEEVPIFTATRASVRQAGKAAAEMLLTAIANPCNPPEGRLIEATLVVGGSTGPLRQH